MVILVVSYHLVSFFANSCHSAPCVVYYCRLVSILSFRVISCYALSIFLSFLVISSYFLLISVVYSYFLPFCVISYYLLPFVVNCCHFLLLRVISCEFVPFCLFAPFDVIFASYFLCLVISYRF